MSHWRPPLNIDKYKQALLFLLNSTANNTLLGKVKLFKLLYYLDFDHYQVFKTPITGDIYRKLPYGPVPANAQDVLSEMVDSGQVTISQRRVRDYLQYVFTANAESDTDAFTSSEMEVLEQTTKKWANHTTNEIVAATHGEAPWRAVEMGAEIPYALAFYRREIVEESDNDEEAPFEIAAAS